MTPPTTPPPLPFAELLRIADTRPLYQDTVAWSMRMRAMDEISSRLLSWAHAGGVEAMSDLLLHCDDSSDGETEFEKAVLRARASLALLDGQREEP